jgi:hypothetical protein
MIFDIMPVKNIIGNRFNFGGIDRSNASALNDLCRLQWRKSGFMPRRQWGPPPMFECFGPMGGAGKNEKI